MRTINFADIEKERLCDYSLFEYAHLGDCFRGEITPIGDFFMCLTDPEKSSFVFKLPKIPIYILDAISGFFSYIANEYNTEAALQLFYDRKTSSYELYIPEQYVDDVSVEFERNWQMESSDNYYLVADIHSHGNIKAFFSYVDNQDEKGTRLFGVFGGFNEKPSFFMRAGSGGYFKNISTDIFDASYNSHEMAVSLKNVLLNNIDKISFN